MPTPQNFHCLYVSKGRAFKLELSARTCVRCHTRKPVKGGTMLNRGRAFVCADCRRK